VDRWRLDQVIVVQHQHDLVGLLDQLVDQHGQHHLQRRLAALEQGINPLVNPGPQLVQGRGDIAPEPRRVTVAAVQRQPGHRLPAAPSPIPQQAGLAETGRRTDQGEGTGRPLVEALQQPRAGHETGSGPGDVQLGRQQAVPLGRHGFHRRRRGRLSHGNSHARAHPTGAFRGRSLCPQRQSPEPRRQDPPYLPLSSDAVRLDPSVGCRRDTWERGSRAPPASTGT
jgi:hypothetical protein